MHGGVKHPVFYASKKLIPREQNYSVGEREALAIIWALSVFFMMTKLIRTPYQLVPSVNQSINGLLSIAA